ncbi:NAD-P-binding protein [Cristinia sonorae]|uniref:NAD-P-binding protein n=1 Tax=Cristinia sonorae TaxID=1940300 RepID=A0A8K0UN56_9AGAR|nr:NAD-P-binding protein [Cristinia sonorae]
MADKILDQLCASKMFDMTGVVAVVTGGGSGIGLMISTTLVSNGATVFIIGPVQADLDRIAKLYNEGAEKLGRKGRMYGIAGDSEAKRLAEEVEKRTPYITVLFNNAGILAGKFKKPDSTRITTTSPEESFADSLSVNSVGPYWLTFTFLPLLQKWKENQFGNGTRKFAPQIIMTSSMNGWTKDPATSGRSFPYMFSKSAIGHATSSLAHELLPLGIRVNGIAPGLFTTEMSAPGTADQYGISHSPQNTHPFAVPTQQLPESLGGPVSAGGSNRDMGSLALFLVSNFFVNGETVLIDGGTLLLHPSSY